MYKMLLKYKSINSITLEYDTSRFNKNTILSVCM